MEAKLIVVGGKAQANEFPLSLPAIVGRSRAADLPLNHPLVSRQHCELFESGGNLMVRDLGSLNGTFIGQSRITNEVVLSPGGLLTIGSVTFKAVYDGVPAAEADGALDFMPAEEAAEAPAGNHEQAEAPAASEAGFDMDWLNDEPETDQAPPAETKQVKPSKAEPEEPENLGDADEEIVDTRTPDPAVAAEAIEDVERGEATSEEEEIAASAHAVEEEANEFAPAEAEAEKENAGENAGENEGDLDDFFRSLSEP
jgi:hypothetical protein